MDFCAAWLCVRELEVGLIALSDDEAVGRFISVVEVDGAATVTWRRVVERELATGPTLESSLLRLRFPAADEARTPVLGSTGGKIMAGGGELEVGLFCLLELVLERSTALMTLFTFFVATSFRVSWHSG